MRKVLVQPDSSSSKVTAAELVARSRWACGPISPSLETCTASSASVTPCLDSALSLPLVNNKGVPDFPPALDEQQA